MKKLALTLFLLAPSVVVPQVQYLRNLGNFSSDPVTCYQAQWYYNTSTKKLMCCEGGLLDGGAAGSWAQCGTYGSGAAGSCSFWSTSSTLAADDGCLYDATANKLTVGVLAVDAGIYPTGNDTVPLGDDTHRFSDLWLGPASIHVGTTTGDELLMSYNTASNVVEVTVAGTPTIAMQAGKVAIGATGARSSLDVNGNMAIGTTYAGPTGVTGPTNGLIVEGKVGIGTSAPINVLDVEGAAVIGTTYSGTATGPTNGLLVEGKVAIGATGATYDLSLGGGVARTISMERATTSAGYGLTVGAGAATGTNQLGGNLVLNSGIARGTGSSLIDFGVSAPGVSGATDNVVTSEWRLDSAALYPTINATYSVSMSQAAGVGSQLWGGSPGGTTMSGLYVDAYNDENGVPVFVNTEWGNTTGGSGRGTGAYFSKCNGSGGADCSAFTTGAASTTVYKPFSLQQNSAWNSGKPVFATYSAGTGIVLSSCVGASPTYCSSITQKAVLTPAGTEPWYIAFDISDNGKIFFAWDSDTELKYAYCTAVNLTTGPVECSGVSAEVAIGVAGTGVRGVSLSAGSKSAVGDTPVIGVNRQVNDNSLCRGTLNIYSLCGGGSSCATEDLTGASVNTLLNEEGQYISPFIRKNGKVYFTKNWGTTYGDIGGGNYWGRLWVYGGICGDSYCSTITNAFSDQGTGWGGFNGWGCTAANSVGYARWFKTSVAGVMGYWGMTFGNYPTNVTTAFVRTCSDSACASYTSYDVSSLTPYYVNNTQPLIGVPAIERITGDVNFTYSFRNTNTYRYLQIDQVNLSTVTAIGENVGTATNKVSNVTAIGTVKAGSVIITGTGSGYGLLTLGNLGSDPVVGIEGQMIFNASTHKFRCFQNTSWTDCGVGATDLLIGGNAYAGPVSVGTMVGYPYSVALRSNGHNYVTVSPDGGVTVDIDDGGSFRGTTMSAENWKFSRGSYAFTLADAGSFNIGWHGTNEMTVVPDGGVSALKLQIGGVVFKSHSCTLDGGTTPMCNFSSTWKCSCSDDEPSNNGVTPLAANTAAGVVTVSGNVAGDTSIVNCVCAP